MWGGADHMLKPANQFGERQRDATRVPMLLRKQSSLKEPFKTFQNHSAALYLRVTKDTYGSDPLLLFTKEGRAI